MRLATGSLPDHMLSHVLLSMLKTVSISRNLEKQVAQVDIHNYLIQI